MTYEIILLFAIGVGGGFISGLVGIGGAIIIYPAILLISPLFGFSSMSPYLASGLTSAQVFFSTLSGAFLQKRNLNFHLISS